MPTYRSKQTERGLEALRMLAKYLEEKYGPLTVSINESNYTIGRLGKPDLIFGDRAIEVKRVEFFTRHHFKEQEYWAHINNVSVHHQQWDDLKAWAQQHGKKVYLIVVLTFGHQEPIFIEFNQAQMDQLQAKQKHKKWFQMNAWQILKQARIL